MLHIKILFDILMTERDFKTLFENLIKSYFIHELTLCTKYKCMIIVVFQDYKLFKYIM